MPVNVAFFLRSSPWIVACRTSISRRRPFVMRGKYPEDVVEKLSRRGRSVNAACRHPVDSSPSVRGSCDGRIGPENVIEKRPSELPEAGRPLLFSVESCKVIILTGQEYCCSAAAPTDRPLPCFCRHGSRRLYRPPPVHNSL